MMKKCNHCHEVKDLSCFTVAFGDKEGTPEGHRADCILCECLQRVVANIIDWDEERMMSYAKRYRNQSKEEGHPGYSTLITVRPKSYKPRNVLKIKSKGKKQKLTKALEEFLKKAQSA